LDAPDPADYVEPHDDDVHHDDHLDGWGDDGGGAVDHSDVEGTPEIAPAPTPPAAPKKLNTGKERRVSSCKKKKGKPTCKTCKAKKGEPCIGSSSSAPVAATGYLSMNQAERIAHVAADPG
jgi:hypothetical protein